MIEVLEQKIETYQEHPLAILFMKEMTCGSCLALHCVIGKRHIGISRITGKVNITTLR